MELHPHTPPAPLAVANTAPPPARGSAFVTGGTGFLGRHLVPALLRAGYTVRLLARDPAKHGWLAHYPAVTTAVGDITDTDAVVRAAQGADVIIHAAGLFRFWGDDALFARTNVDGTRAILQAAHSVRPRRLIHVSTIALIGQPDPTRIVDETHPPHPVDPYQRSKWQAEQLVRAEAEAVKAVVVRPGAFYGPLGHYAFNRLFFHDPLRGLMMQINGGRYLTFPAYIGDVAAGILLAIDRGQIGEVYNIVGDSLTHKQVFDIVAAEAGLRFPRIPLPGWLGVNAARVLTAIAAVTGREPFYPINLKSYVYNDWRCSNAKAKAELGFQPLDFRDGARRTLAWYRAGQPEFIPEVEVQLSSL